MSGYWRGPLIEDNWEYYEEKGEPPYAIDMWFHPTGESRNLIAIAPRWDVIYMPDHIKTIEEAQAWALAVWRMR